MRISLLNVYRKRAIKISISILVLLLVVSPASHVLSLSAEQRRVFDSGVYYFNVEDDPECSVGVAGAITTNLKEFVDTYGQIIFDMSKQYGLPYEAVIAQAGIESAWGKSKLSSEAFNFFGMKAGSSWSGPVYVANTREENPDGSSRYQNDAFRAYPNAQAGFNGYGDFIVSNSRYSEALKYPSDPVQYITELKKAGYATDSKYIDTNVRVQQGVISYINEKGLFPPSSQVAHDTSPPSSSTPASASGCAGAAAASATNIVTVAEAELAKGPVEYDDNVLKYSDGNREAWCADFVSWVYKEAGVPFSDGLKGWRIPSVRTMQAWFQEDKPGREYFAVGTKAPQPGDVAFYIGEQTPDGGSTSHVNIVISVSGDSMVTIGGNESDMVKKSVRKIQLDSQSLVGFGRITK